MSGVRPENRRLAAHIRALQRAAAERARRAVLEAGGSVDAEPPVPVPLDDLDEEAPLER